MDSLSITQPDDWHLHLRSGVMLRAVARYSAQYFGRAIVMPNLQPPVTSVALAAAYRREILQALPPDSGFTPLMTLYLTQATPVTEIQAAAASGFIFGVKLYPAGATTNAEHGVADVRAVYPLLAEMQRLDLPLLVHAEVNDAAVDVFDREKVFIERHLQAIVREFPDLRVVVEHLTTQEAVDFVWAQGPKVASTLTPQHLLFNRNALLAGGVRPHFYCLPVLKRERHRQALLAAAVSGNPKFFLGTDSAPHLTHLKQSACGCAGCFNAPVALALYAQAFEQAGALDKLEGFASFYGADFYRLPRNSAKIRLYKQDWQAPTAGDPDLDVTPFLAGEALAWQARLD